MSMARKRARARRGGEPDRLSALPDCLLHAIMSFLKARQAVQTCVLSRRWRHLWRTVPCLDVDLNEFMADMAAVAPDFSNNDAGAGSGGSGGDIPDPGIDDSSDSDDGSSGGTDHDSSGSEDGSISSASDIDTSDSYFVLSSSSSDDDDDVDRKDAWERFEDFTVNLMVHCNVAQLDSFSLRICRGRAPRFGARQAAGWLRRAMKYCTPYRAPAPRREESSSASWLLKRLHLCYVRLDHRFAEHVSLVCRSLEDLELDSCACEIQSITSHSLKTLVLKYCRLGDLSGITSPTLKTLVIDGGSNVYSRQLAISAPVVAYLHLAVPIFHFRGGISINEMMPSLAKALIYLRGHKSGLPPSNLGNDQSKLLCSVFNVTSLELSGVGTMVLGKEPTFQEFKNLRNLVLGKCDLRDDFRTLRFFLQGSPYLEKLTLRHCQFPKYSKKKKGTPKQNKPSSSDEFHGLDFVCKNLKIEIIYNNGSGRQLMKLLLRASGNLSKRSVKLTKVK